MAGTLTVQNLQGPSSGANANTVLIPSGQTLYAPGHVVQVVKTDLADGGGFFNTTSASHSTVLTANITPTSSSSKIFISITGPFYKNNDIGNTAGCGFYRVTRDGTALPSVTWPQTGEAYSHFTAGTYDEFFLIYPFSFQALDNPATTSQVTYNIDIRSGASGNSFVVYNSACMTLMEIAQ